MSSHMKEKTGIVAIFRKKEFADTRAEKARGCFGSSKVSKSVIVLNYSFILGMLQLSPVNNKLFSSLKKRLGRLSFSTRLSKHICVI